MFESTLQRALKSGLLSTAAVFGVPRGVVVMNTTIQARIDDLEARVQALVAEGDEIVNNLGEGVDLTAEQTDKINANADKAETLRGQIAALKALQPAAGGQGRRTVPEPQNGRQPAGGSTRVETPLVNKRTGGFAHIGEFAACVRGARMGQENAVQKLLNANMSEGVGEDGGFLVPAEFRESIMKIVEGEDSLLSRTDGSTTSKNAVTQNIDSKTPWGTGGINVYWEGEGQAATAANAKFEQTTLRLNKLFARVDVTEELLEDAPQLDNYLRVKAPEVMTSVINLAIVQGNGVGKPLGIMNSPALVTVSKFTSQPADTIFHRNLVEMMGRMYAPSWGRAVWLMHQDVWAKLPLISFRDVGSTASTATTAAFPAYMPPSGIDGQPYGTLLGRPIVVLEAMETIGDLGDIILADMSAYRTVTKSGGMRVDTSIHLMFDTDKTAYRFIFRLAGAPWWSSTISPRDGSNTRSPFVTLESR